MLEQHVEGYLASLEHPQQTLRQEGAAELHEWLFAEGDLVCPEDAAHIVAGLAALLTRNVQGAGLAAALLIDVLAAAHREGHQLVLAAATAIDTVPIGSLEPVVADAVRAAQDIRDGVLVDEQVISEMYDAAVATDLAALQSEDGVMAWCRGKATVDDSAAHTAVRLLAEIALRSSRTRVAQWEPIARQAVLSRDSEARPGIILDQSHRAIFHAVLAWRLDCKPAFWPGFGSHREEERALAQWAVEAESDPLILARMLALLQCDSLADLRDRERVREQGEIAFPDGDIL